MVFTHICNICFWFAVVILMAKLVFNSPLAKEDCQSLKFIHTSTITANDSLVPAGYEIEMDMRLGLHVCRALHNGHHIPGKKVPGACYVPFQGQGYGYLDHEVLINPNRVNLSWVKSSTNNVLPSGAISIGKMLDGTILYTGRCYIRQNDGNTILVPGNLTPISHNRYLLRVVFGSSTEYNCHEYEVLVCQ